jgi:cytochrome c oxidase subunit 2
MKRSVIAAVGLAVVLASAAPAQEPPDVERGRRLFTESGCHGCHKVGAVGTPIGPDLSHVGRRHRASSLAAWLRDPRGQRPSAHMPLLELSEEQVRSLAAYLSTLQ